MIFSIITFITALILSSAAIYFSVTGLAAIFAGAALTTMIMGTILEISKLVAVVWLHKNWKKSPWWIKLYMLPAILVLMLITSMGIFGGLSKSHIEQGVPTGDIAVKVEIIDQQIKTEQSVIQSARDDLALLNAQLTKYTELGYVTKGVNVRKGQEEERAYIAKEIKKSQETISKLRRDRAPLSSQLRRAEADVGPIKYIAQLIYGDNPGTTVLEKAVVWVIIIIVFVFDPLAVLLLLSAQLSFGWWKIERDKGQKRRVEDEEQPEESSNKEVEKDSPIKDRIWPNDSVEVEDILEDGLDDTEPEAQTVEEAIELFVNPAKPEKEPPHTAATHSYLNVDINEAPTFKPLVHHKEEHTAATHPYLTAGIGNAPNFEPMVYKPEEPEQQTFEEVVEEVTDRAADDIREQIDKEIIEHTKEEAIVSVFDQLAEMSEEELAAALDEAPDTPLGAAIAEALAELENGKESEENQLTEESEDTILEEQQIVAEEDDHEEDIINDVVQTNKDTIDIEEKDPKNASLDQEVSVDQKDIDNVSDFIEPDQKNEYIDNNIIIDEEQEIKKKHEKVNWIERVSGEQVKRTID